MSSVPKIGHFLKTAKTGKHVVQAAIIDTKAEEEGNALNAACPGERVLIFRVIQGKFPPIRESGTGSQADNITLQFPALDLSRSKVGGRQVKMAVSLQDAKGYLRSDS